MNARNTPDLLSLFGRWTLAEAECTRLEDLQIDADRVAEAARQVIAERGDPERQRAIVAAMDDKTALALCIWLRDPAKAADLLARIGKLPKRPRP
jgi:hypothetical protein